MSVKPPVFITNDPVWLHENDCFGTKDAAVFMRQYKGGNCVVFSLHDGKERQTHCRNLSRRYST